MAQLFSAETYINAVMDQPLERRIPLPPNDYVGIIQKVEARQWSSKSDPSKSGVALDISIQLDLPFEVQQECQMDKPIFTIRDSVMLDLTENGALAQGPGQNRRLRGYREATNKNQLGVPFSPKDLVGCLIKVRIVHDLYEDQPIEKITAVTEA